MESLAILRLIKESAYRPQSDVYLPLSLARIVGGKFHTPNLSVSGIRS